MDIKGPLIKWFEKIKLFSEGPEPFCDMFLHDTRKLKTFDKNNELLQKDERYRLILDMIYANKTFEMVFNINIKF